MRALVYAWLLFKACFSGALVFAAFVLIAAELERGEMHSSAFAFAAVLILVAALPWRVRAVRNVRAGAILLFVLGSATVWRACEGLTQGFLVRCRSSGCQIERLIHRGVGDDGLALLWLLGGGLLLAAAAAMWKRSRTVDGDAVYIDDVPLAHVGASIRESIVDTPPGRTMIGICVVYWLAAVAVGVFGMTPPFGWRRSDMLWTCVGWPVIVLVMFALNALRFGSYRPRSTAIWLLIAAAVPPFVALRHGV